MAAGDAALSAHQVVKDEPPGPSLTRRKLLQVNANLQLDVITDSPDALWRIVLANKVLFASLEEPEVRLVNFLKRKIKTRDVLIVQLAVKKFPNK